MKEGRPPLDKGGLQGGFEHENQPTPALRDRCRCGEGFSSLHPLRRRGFSDELSVEEHAGAKS